VKACNFALLKLSTDAVNSDTKKYLLCKLCHVCSIQNQPAYNTTTKASIRKAKQPKIGWNMILLLLLLWT
jgi:hypothetical protein